MTQKLSIVYALYSGNNASGIPIFLYNVVCPPTEITCPVIGTTDISKSQYAKLFTGNVTIVQKIPGFSISFFAQTGAFVLNRCEPNNYIYDNPPAGILNIPANTNSITLQELNNPITIDGTKFQSFEAYNFYWTSCKSIAPGSPPFSLPTKIPPPISNIPGSSGFSRSTKLKLIWIIISVIVSIIIIIIIIIILILVLKHHKK